MGVTTNSNKAPVVKMKPYAPERLFMSKKEVQALDKAQAEEDAKVETYRQKLRAEKQAKLEEPKVDGKPVDEKRLHLPKEEAQTQEDDTNVVYLNKQFQKALEKKRVATTPEASEEADKEVKALKAKIIKAKQTKPEEKPSRKKKQ